MTTLEYILKLWLTSGLGKNEFPWCRGSLQIPPQGSVNDHRFTSFAIASFSSTSRNLSLVFYLFFLPLHEFIQSTFQHSRHEKHHQQNSSYQSRNYDWPIPKSGQSSTFCKSTYKIKDLSSFLGLIQIKNSSTSTKKFIMRMILKVNSKAKNFSFWTCMTNVW